MKGVANHAAPVMQLAIRFGGAAIVFGIWVLLSEGRRAFTDGTLRSHAQGAYFTCPQFLDNPEGAVTGTEVQDGGMPDLPLGGMSFQGGIQSDIDERGCATGGCHEVIDGPGKLHLIFRPRTADELLRNYNAVLPFTHGDQPGGRFVNQTPLPAPLRQRWIRWISDGERY